MSKVGAFSTHLDAVHHTGCGTDIQHAAWRAVKAASREKEWDAVLVAVESAMPSKLITWTWSARWIMWDVTLALVAYDHSGHYLSMTADELQVWSELSGYPSSALVLSYVTILESIEAMTISGCCDQTRNIS
jgi:hypothetical protein